MYVFDRLTEGGLHRFNRGSATHIGTAAMRRINNQEKRVALDIYDLILKKEPDDVRWETIEQVDAAEPWSIRLKALPFER